MGAAVVGLFVRPLLAERHATRETFDLVRLVSTMLLTFAAIVLGLLTTSAKASFDQIGNDMRRLGIEIIDLDRLLREYGNEANPARELLARYTAGAIASSWPDEPPPPEAPELSPQGGPPKPEPPKPGPSKPGPSKPGSHWPGSPAGSLTESLELGDLLNRMEVQLRRLHPADAMQTRLVSDALNAYQRLSQRRWTLIEEAHRSISQPFYLVLLFWLMVLFLTLGLSAPPNPLVFSMLGLGALSIASAIFVILDLDAPIGGVFSVSSEPLRVALAHLGAPP